MSNYTQQLLTKANKLNANIEIDPTSGIIMFFNDTLTEYYDNLSTTRMIHLIANITKPLQGFTVNCTDGCYILTKQ